MIKKIVGALVPLLFIGCTTTAPTPVVASPKYELLLTGTIDGNPFQGVGVGSQLPSHTMQIQSAIAVDYFTVQTCHRSVQFNGVIPPDPWWQWGSDNKSFTWNYSEAPTIEDTGDCILRFCAFSKVVSSPPVACAIVDFKASKYILPSENICNGSDGQASGTAICHTQVGLLERMRFTGSTLVDPQAIDPTGKTAPYWITGQCQGKFLDPNQTLFEYQVPENECSVIFMEKTAPYRRAKLTVIPYDLPQYQTGGS